MLYYPTMRVEQKTAWLAMPYRFHSKELRKKIKEECKRIVFYDYGVVIKRKGRWQIEKWSGEAMEFKQK